MANEAVFVNGAVVFTRDFEAGWVKGEKTIKQGTRAIITRVHWGVLGDVTHLDVRLADGTFLREVEFDYFSTGR